VDDAIEAWLERYGFLSAPSSSGTEGSTEDIDWDVLIGRYSNETPMIRPVLFTSGTRIHSNVYNICIYAYMYIY
jgi:hypothetical protein